MKHIIIFLLITLSICNISIAQINCDCYSIENVEISKIDTLSLTLSNDCDDHVYLNLYIINSKPPFDTLAKQDHFNAAFPIGENTTQYLETKLTNIPVFGTYRLSIGYGEFSPDHCDSLKFSVIFTGLNNNFNTELSIYPVPVERFLFVDLINSITYIKITNLNGHSDLLQIDNNRIDLGQLESGIYILEFYNNKSELIGRRRILKD